MNEVSQPSVLNDPNVSIIELPGKTVYIVGTAHVSRSSVELAENVIREVHPTTVAVELCESRFNSLRDPHRWKNTDIVSVIKEGKAFVLLAQLMLAAFQKKLGEHLQVKPGEEMLRAVKVAEEVNAGIALVDREVRITLKRVWATLSIFGIGKLLFAMITGLFGDKQIEAEEIERLKSADALDELLRDFSQALPGVREALIDERDIYLGQKIKIAAGDKIVAVVGAGHVPGILKTINSDHDLKKLEEIPPPGIGRKIAGWSLPALVVALIVYGFVATDAHTSKDMILTWCVINFIAASLGALIARGHILTVLAAGLSAPFTAINPFIASGWVAGLVEASLSKPKVSDFETIADDMSTVKGLFKNRISKILLIICSTNLFGTIGTIVGVERIVALLR